MWGAGCDYVQARTGKRSEAGGLGPAPGGMHGLGNAA